MLRKPTLLRTFLFSPLFLLQLPPARAAVIAVNATCSLANAIVAANTTPESVKIPRSLFARLTDAVCYAA